MAGRTYKTFQKGPSEVMRRKVAGWGQKLFSTVCLLNGNDMSPEKYSSYNQIFALGVAEECFGDETLAFSRLREFSDRYDDWLFGFLTYDLKNQLERLTSSHFDGIGMPLMHFFRPRIVIFQQADEWVIGCLPGYGHLSDPEVVFSEIVSFPHDGSQKGSGAVPAIQARVSRSQYLEAVSAIKTHIQQGDIYEMNYCMEFFAEGACIDPPELYENLIRQSPTPFSCYYSINGKSLLCASPERFLRKQGDTIISQPIKGTIARGTNPDDDARQAGMLRNDPKERSENVMIVDLVRNDLARTAKKGSVRVEELFGIYAFRQVHQMISTIASELRPDCHFTEVIRQAFPMGSMTGAPKIRAMQLIEQYERTKRGLYSGAVGYISPGKDFDFNVVIRSILYNRENRYLGFMAGSAITAGSIPEKEYEECLLKAQAMIGALNSGHQGAGGL